MYVWNLSIFFYQEMHVWFFCRLFIWYLTRPKFSFHYILLRIVVNTFAPKIRFSTRTKILFDFKSQLYRFGSITQPKIQSLRGFCIAKTYVMIILPETQASCCVGGGFFVYRVFKIIECIKFLSLLETLFVRALSHMLYTFPYWIK